MGANIIELNAFRRSNIRCAAIGLVFPQVYRRRGRHWEVTPGGETIPGAFAPPEYSLSADGGFDLAEAHNEPIDRLDPAIDSGWLVLRHHRSEESVNGYIDACIDLDREAEVEQEQMVWRTPAGLFTLARRPPNPGCPDCLIIYAASIPHPDWGEDRWTKAVDAAGQRHGEDILSSET